MLYKAIIATTFGRHSMRPFRTALVRLCCIWIITMVLGWMWAKLMPLIPFVNISAWQIAMSMTFAVELIVLSALLVSLAAVHPEDKLRRLLSCWPLSRHRLWLALLLPAGVTGCLAISFTILPLNAIAYGTHLPAFATITSIVLGSGSAFGLLYGLQSAPFWQRAGFMTLMISLQYLLINSLYKSQHNTRLLAGGLLLVTFIGTALLFILSSRSIDKWRHPEHLRNVRTAFVPNSLWFLKKIMRNSTTILGISITFIMASLLAIAYLKQRVIDPSLLSGAASILGAAFASDVRAITLRHNPPEIVGLKGSLHFGTAQLTGTLVMSIVALGPLLIVLLANGNTTPTELYALSMQPLLGISAGICASTLIVPIRGDVTAQCSATLFAVALLVVPQLLFKSINLSIFAVVTFGLSVGLVALALFIEHKRNPYVWRKHDTIAHNIS